MPTQASSEASNRLLEAVVPCIHPQEIPKEKATALSAKEAKSLEESKRYHKTISNPMTNEESKPT